MMMMMIQRACVHANHAGTRGKSLETTAGEYARQLRRAACGLVARGGSFTAKLTGNEDVKETTAAAAAAAALQTRCHVRHEDGTQWSLSDTSLARFAEGSGILVVEHEQEETRGVVSEILAAVVSERESTSSTTTTTTTTTTTSASVAALHVDYRERQYASRKIPSTFTKSEGAPRDHEILTARAVDRSIRPVFPKGYDKETQVSAIVLGSDGKHPSDVYAINATSLAIMRSALPWQGPVAAVRLGVMDVETSAQDSGDADGNALRVVVNPTQEEMQQCRFNLLYAGTESRCVMAEAGGKMAIGHQELATLMKTAQERVGLLARAQMELLRHDMDQQQQRSSSRSENSETHHVQQQETKEEKRNRRLAALKDAGAQEYQLAREIADEIRADLHAIYSDASIGKQERGRRRTLVFDAVEAKRSLADDEKGDTGKASIALVRGALTRAERIIVHEMARAGIRVDSRKPDEVRALHAEAGLVRSAHGSSVFTRGETQVLAVATIGSIAEDAQKLVSLTDNQKKRFMMHYTFPSFSVGEIRGGGGGGTGRSRREIGHGALAERGLVAVLPSEESFPYSIRVNAETLMSGGSSSMASASAGSLALADAGIPISEHAGGIAVGVMMPGDGSYESDNQTGPSSTHDTEHPVILTDINGLEDFHGDMDMKVIGTSTGITALQLDVKRPLPVDVLPDALEAATRGVAAVIDALNGALDEPRSSLPPDVPLVAKITIHPERVGKVIGSGGATVKQICRDTGSKVSIGDDNVVTVEHATREGLLETVGIIERIGRGDNDASFSSGPPHRQHHRSSNHHHAPFSRRRSDYDTPPPSSHPSRRSHHHPKSRKHHHKHSPPL